MMKAKRRHVMAYQLVQSRHLEGCMIVGMDVAMILCLEVPADWAFPLAGNIRPPTGRGRTFRLALNHMARELPVIQKWIDAFVAKHAMSSVQKAEFLRMMKLRRRELQTFERRGPNGVNHKFNRVLIGGLSDER